MPKIDTPITATAHSLERLLASPLPSLLVIYDQNLPTSFENAMKKRAKEAAEQLLIVKLDAANNPDLNQHYDLPKGAPVLIAYQNGAEIARRHQPTANTLENYADYLLGKSTQLETAPPPPTQPLHVTDRDFAQTVLSRPEPVLVDFWADWCPPCRAIAPSLNRLANEFAGKVTIAKLDVDQNPLITQQYRVQGFPTLLMFKNGKVVDRLVGAAPEPVLRQFLQKHS